ncbi:MAG: hypothetical protein ACSHX6_05240 [Akkermansiaceae bacterium]
MATISRGVPGGCLIGLGAIFCFIFALLGAWGMWLWFGLPDDERVYSRYFWTMLSVLVGGVLGAVVLCFFAVRMVRGMDSAGDKDYEPMIRW